MQSLCLDAVLMRHLVRGYFMLGVLVDLTPPPSRAGFCAR